METPLTEMTEAVFPLMGILLSGAMAAATADMEIQLMEVTEEALATMATLPMAVMEALAHAMVARFSANDFSKKA